MGGLIMIIMVDGKRAQLHQQKHRILVQVLNRHEKMVDQMVLFDPKSLHSWLVRKGHAIAR